MTRPIAAPPSPFRLRPLAVACALVAWAPAVHAQHAATDLDAVRVNAYRAANSVSSATKTSTSVAETPQSVSVIERAELDARGVQSLNDAMRYVAGVSLESSGIDNRVDDFRIRGFDAGSWANNVTLDGMRAPQGSQWNRSMFDSWNLERVEVLKGPSAVMYGQVAPGGMVNQVSKTPQPRQLQQLRLGLDAHGQYSAAFDVGTGSDDDVHLARLVGLYRDGDTQIKHTGQEHWFLAPSYTWQMAERTRITLLGMYQKDDGGSTYQFLPMDGTLRATPYGHMKNTTFIGEPSWNTFNRTLWTAGWMFEHAFNDHLTFSQSARRTHVDSLYRGVVTNGALNADGRTQARRATYGTGDSDGDTFDTRLQARFRTGGVDHVALLGWDWQRADWEGVRGAMSSPRPIDIFNPVHTGYVPQVTSLSPTEGSNRQSGIYLQDQLALGQWRLTVGGRYDWTKDDASSATRNPVTGATVTQPRSVIKNEAFTGRAGVLYVFDNGLTPYISYAESFQPSSTSPLNNFDGSAFDPVTGTQWEAGLKYQPARIDGLVTLSAFELRQQNLLTQDPDPTHNTCGATANARCSIQDGEGRVRGVELEGRVTPFEGFSLIGAATWMDSEMTRSDQYQGKQLIMVPDYTASFWADYTFAGGALEGLSLAAGARYNGRSYGDSANLYRIPGYTLFDAAIRYDVGRVGNSDLQLAVNLSNLADRRYVSTCTTVSSCYYGSGRTVMATARLGW
ncbi:TonB-dependent siderophore receptor [Stenotrophomonas sp. Sa5BUN4]|uniref:TonB-dependent siderophore receptor n=1 Tax=Stenotrophomonas lacuserhaii TaxID=2760084 RepID=A0A8X8K1K7_9GAMM|nr:TonB-dependent siderophore receptor [Stenotrophomonas pennii]MBD7953050.1 TonB-dependent siderophore receptor [Stenotrophomonas pennii]